MGKNCSVCIVCIFIYTVWFVCTVLVRFLSKLPSRICRDDFASVWCLGNWLERIFSYIQILSFRIWAFKC